jgi:hypothetical protein
MKYVFFHRDRFGSDTAWYIGEGKDKPMVRRATFSGLQPAFLWTFEQCMLLVNAGIWTMRKYKT